MNVDLRLLSGGAIRGAALLAVAALAACGGGGDAPPPPAVSTGPLAAATACTIAALQPAVPGAVLTTVATVTPATGSPYCRVDGYVTTQGPGTTSNQVRFMVAMPPSFQARYLFVGTGGSAGFIPEPSASLLADGYAVAGSDAGTTTPGINWLFAIDRTKAYDYARRGVHVSAVATQSLVRAYYGMAPGGANASRRLYRYIDGCSGGARMGIVAASHYPDDFDGVVAGAPGISVTNQMFFGKVSKYLIDHPDAWISPAQLQALDAALLAKFDGADGAVDGLLADPGLLSLDAGMRALFTPAQQVLLDMMLNGMNDFGLIYTGFTLGNPIGWSTFMFGSTPPPWSLNPVDGRPPPAGYLVFDTTSRGLFGPTYDFSTEFSFASSSDVNGWNAMFESVFIGSGTAKASNLNRFFQRGGKMLFWHGTADNAISINDSFRFFNDMVTAQGGQAKLAQVAQLYTVPGMLHCFGGVGPQDVAAQALPALAKWVETGIAPTQLVANRVASASLPARSFLLCPTPQRAAFKGGVANSGGLDVNDAANWSCQAP